MPEPIRTAIVGAGPSGFYAAGQLLAVDDPAFAVDLYDRLPTPYGLVRSGVAPDHPKIKSVTRAYDKTTKHPRFRFFGHVELGSDISRQQLLEHYHVVLYTLGTSIAWSAVSVTASSDGASASIRATSIATLPAPTTTT